MNRVTSLFGHCPDILSIKTKRNLYQVSNGLVSKEKLFSSSDVGKRSKTVFYKCLAFLSKLQIVELVQCLLVAEVCRLVLYEWEGYSVPG